jgi:diguanylate cyclase (GGDEF)-like protein
MSRKILIVDDEVSNLSVIAHAFDRMVQLHYEILQTPSPARALEIAVAEQPDLVITDWDMPGMDGIELIRRLKADEATRDIPVIMCTGVMTTSENLQAALSAGAVDYIRKPVDAIELTARTHSMLQLASSFRRIRKQNQELRENYQRMEWMARTDMLTELSNRRDSVDALKREIAIARRHHRPLTLALADVDEFKAFNDRHGHACGDFVLRALAGLLRSSVRGQDHVGRWGGEEFVLLFPDTEPDGAQVAAEKICRLVEGRDWRFEDVPLRITLTIGLCGYDGVADIDRLLRLADGALYEGKAAGRNRVVVRR